MVEGRQEGEWKNRVGNIWDSEYKKLKTNLYNDNKINRGPKNRAI